MPEEPGLLGSLTNACAFSMTCMELCWRLIGQLPCTLPQEMFNDDAFSKIKKGARIVNVARGGVIDDAALARALDSGAVAQASARTVVCCEFSPLASWSHSCASYLGGNSVTPLAASTIAAPCSTRRPVKLQGNAPSSEHHAHVSTSLSIWPWVAACHARCIKHCVPGDCDCLTGAGFST